MGPAGGPARGPVHLHAVGPTSNLSEHPSALWRQGSRQIRRIRRLAPMRMKASPPPLRMPTAIVPCEGGPHFGAAGPGCREWRWPAQTRWSLLRLCLARIDIDPCAGILAKRLDDQRRKLAGFRPLGRRPGSPTPSSATITRQPVSSTRLCSVIVPPSRPAKACLSALVSSSLTTRPVGMATLIETGQVSTLQVEADAFDRVRLHDGRRDLAEIHAEVDAVIGRFRRQQAIQQGERIHPARQPVEPLSRRVVRQIARFQPDQGGDHLEIVLHAMLQLAQQRVLVSRIFCFQIFVIRTVPCG